MQETGTNQLLVKHTAQVPESHRGGIKYDVCDGFESHASTIENKSYQKKKSPYK